MPVYAANSTPNGQGSGPRPTATHKTCLSSVSSLLVLVPVIAIAIAIITVPNPPSLPESLSTQSLETRVMVALGGEVNKLL